MAIGIIQISVPPAPGHHAGKLGYVEALLLKLATEVVEIVNLEVETDTITRNGGARTSLMQGDSSIAARCTHARVHRHSFIAELFDQLESKHVAVEVESAIHVFHVDHGVVEGKFSVRVQGRGSLGVSGSCALGSCALRQAKFEVLLRRAVPCT